MMCRIKHRCNIWVQFFKAAEQEALSLGTQAHWLWLLATAADKHQEVMTLVLMNVLAECESLSSKTCYSLPAPTES